MKKFVQSSRNWSSILKSLVVRFGNICGNRWMTSWNAQESTFKNLIEWLGHFWTFDVVLLKGTLKTCNAWSLWEDYLCSTWEDKPQEIFQTFGTRNEIIITFYATNLMIFLKTQGGLINWSKVKKSLVLKSGLISP